MIRPTSASHRTLGYARVSRDEQDPRYQVDALTGAGCSHIFEDRISGKQFKRAGLDQALARLRAGDELIVWKLDRLGRTMWETMQIIMDLDRRGIGFRSLTESLDARTPMGRGILALLAAVAEDEHAKLCERTRAGMAAKKRAGVHVGRPRKLTDQKLEFAYRLIKEGSSPAATAGMIGVHPSTLRRAINPHKRVR
ncbi:recombinase family protein [Sinorhizobium meliloti]|uniref:recombinase family protein n=1 Tax=Rhizobium meliloti TaxID=382 RepID=UPI000FD8B98B|nr:recombinase family protein [Sinorhizobium meliloti]RVH60073.1 recombinase family protein [Sinorhizobium meliloti]